MILIIPSSKLLFTSFLKSMFRASVQIIRYHKFYGHFQTTKVPVIHSFISLCKLTEQNVLCSTQKFCDMNYSNLCETSYQAEHNTFFLENMKCFHFIAICHQLITYMTLCGLDEMYTSEILDEIKKKLEK